MSKLSRVIQRIFGETGITSQFGKFGSNAASPPGTTTKDLTLIQSLSQYLLGWYSATANAAEPPRIQDRNALDLLFSSQLKYLFQNGLAEWLDDVDQRYYADVSFCTRSGSIYQAILGDDASNINAQKDPLTNPLWWRLIAQVDAVGAWDTAESTAYNTPGVVVERFSTHYTSSGKAGNSAKDPANPQNATWWIASPGKDKLVEWFNSNIVIYSGMHPSNDRSSGDYQQNILLDTLKLGSTTYEFHKVLLDGTVVTGDTTLENDIFDVGGAKEYPWIDEYAPDSLGTRTLIDMGERVLAAQSVSGENDTLAEVLEDRFQGHRQAINQRSNVTVTGATECAVTGTGSEETGDPVTDGVNGTPRTGLTTRPKEFTVGAPYIVVMIAI